MILIFPADCYQFLISKDSINIHPFELATYNQFYVLALFVWIVLFLSKGKLVGSPLLKIRPPCS
jgi:hypothetical protein